MQEQTQTLEQLDARAWQWAIERGLQKTTPKDQFRKIVRRIDDAIETLAQNYAGQCTDKDVALEFGNVLVSLSIAAHLQSATLQQAMAKRPATVKAQSFQNLAYWINTLQQAIAEGKNILPCLGAVGACLQEGARIEIAMSMEECLALTLNKI
jgi:hypothetical protein